MVLSLAVCAALGVIGTFLIFGGVATTALGFGAAGIGLIVGLFC